MNKELLLTSLNKYHKWVIDNKKLVEADFRERHEMCEEMQSYTKEKLANLSEEEFFEMIAPLWAMRIWGNKKYYIDNLVESNGMPFIRQHLCNLFYGQASIEDRWDDFRTNIKGIGPAIMSELLNKFNPKEYILWNKKSLTAFLALQIEKVPKYNSSLDGKRYEYLCSVGRALVKSAQEQGFSEIEDLLALDYFIWQELQIELPSDKLAEPDNDPETPKQKVFVHNDVRDRIRDIGELLGFKASVETPVAEGARVDAIWEVSVGNMGRITYVFEVQTSGSIDSLLLNLMKAKNNPSVQGIVAVSDEKQLEKIKKEASSLKDIRDQIKYWDYNDVLKVYDSLSSAYESINQLGLVPDGIKK